VGGYSVSFTLSDEAAKKIAEKIAASFPDSGIGMQGVTVRVCEGTLSVDTEKGMITAITYRVEGGFAFEGGVGDYIGRYSVLVDRTEEVTLPELQTPTATTPGMVDENEVVPEC
jgi:nucleoside-triphosphatase THEP1